MSKGSEAVKEWRRKTKERMVAAMGGKCVICEYDRCNDGFDFHHLDPSVKEVAFGGARANPKSWERLVKELKGCVLLCCRCHREVHAGIVEVPSEAARFDPEYEDYKSLERELKMEPCPVCTRPKPIHMTTCSKSCAGQHRGKVDWASIDVIALVENGSSLESIGRDLGVTGAAVKKRYSKVKRELGL